MFRCRKLNPSNDLQCQGRRFHSGLHYYVYEDHITDEAPHYCVWGFPKMWWETDKGFRKRLMRERELNKSIQEFIIRKSWVMDQCVVTQTYIPDTDQEPLTEGNEAAHNSGSTHLPQSSD